MTHGWNCAEPGTTEMVVGPDEYAHLIAGYVLEGYVVQSYVQKGKQTVVAGTMGENVIISFDL